MTWLPAPIERITFAVGVAATLGVLAACGGASAAPTATGTPAAASEATVATMETSIGTVLVGPGGRTLYVLVNPQHRPVPCSGACLSVWPPVSLHSGSPRAGSGVTASLSTTPGSGGTSQLAVSGDPVYYYAGDSSAGDANGEGTTSFGGTWYALQPNGQLFAVGSGGNPLGY